MKIEEKLRALISEKEELILALEDDKSTLLEEIAELRKENNTLKQQLEAANRSLKLNSQNSSKPPSSDGLSKPNRNNSLRVSSGRPSGGQKGHKGNTLKRDPNPTSVVLGEASECSFCCKDLSKIKAKKHVKKQVIDIPTPEVVITEYQSEVKKCPSCKKETTANFPSNVTNHVQYGPNIQAIAAYLHQYQLVPLDRVKQIFADHYDLEISEATIESMQNRAADKASSVVEQIDEMVSSSDVVNVDETGARVNGKTAWVHTASTEKATLYKVSEKRSDVMIKGIDVIVHDCFPSYDKKGENHRHAVCCAHILRELKALVDIEKECWAQKAIDFILNLKKIRAAKYNISPQEIEKAHNQFLAIIKQGIKFHESLDPLKQKKRGKKKRRVGHNLSRRLQERLLQVLLFFSDPRVPFTNNLAERDLRPIKLKVKISGSFRTMVGAENFLKIRSVISTAKKQNINLMLALRQMFSDNLNFESG